MTVRVLGTVGVYLDGKLQRVQPSGLNVLAVLVAAGPDGLSADALADEVYADHLTANWENNLRQAVRRVRKALQTELIATGGRHYALDLPTEAVDAWQLRAHAGIDLTSVSHDRLLSLLTDRPYPEPSESRLVAAAATSIEAARIELFDRIAEEAPALLTPTLLGAAANLARTTMNDRIVRSIVDAHLAAEHHAQARAIATAAIERLTEELDALPQALIGHPAIDGGTTPPEPQGPAPQRWIGRSDDAERQALLPRTDLVDDAIARLGTGGRLVVSGASGSGKTHLARSIAQRRFADGHHVIWITAPRDGSAAYGPLLSALPELADELAIAGDTEPSIAEARRLSALSDRLDLACPDRPTTIVIDDAQWLDSHSTRAVDFLARSTTDDELIVVGRPDVDPSAWSRMADSLRRAGADRVDATPFTLDELVELVGVLHPNATSRQRQETAGALMSRRASLPALAAAALSQADPNTLALPIVDHGDASDSELWTAAVSEPTTTLAAAAAIAGVTFEFSDVLALSGVDADSLVEATDELLDANLVVAERRPGRFSFAHLLIRDAFEATLGSAERRALHRRAADLAAASGDPHSRARHLLAATPTVSAEEAIEAVLASAIAHVEAGAWTEAVAAFTTAESLDPDGLDAHHLGRYAFAVERSGGRGETLRRRSAEAALRAGDASTMLDVLLSGVDSGELLEADAQLLDLLDDVPRDALDDEQRTRLDIARCRELGLAGRRTEAIAVYRTLTSGSVADAADAWLAVWSSLVGTPPSTWPGEPPEPDPVTDAVQRARVRTTRCEQALVLGDRYAFERELVALEAEAATREHPIRRWALHLLQSLRAFCDGRLTDAATIAERGHDIGAEFGLSGAFPARSAQLFADQWVRGKHGDLVPVLDAAPPDIRESVLATAAHAAALLDVETRRGDGIELANKVVAQLSTTTQAVHAPVAALLAEAVAALPSTHRPRLRDLLEPHLGHAIIVGAGIAHLGPASRALSRLAVSTDEAQELMVQSVDEADRWQLPIWSVRCRLDLHRLTGDATPLAEARSLAAGTEMTALLP